MNDTPKQSWWQRLSGGLKRTSSQLGSRIAGLVSKRKTPSCVKGFVAQAR